MGSRPYSNGALLKIPFVQTMVNTRYRYMGQLVEHKTTYPFLYIARTTLVEGGENNNRVYGGGVCLLLASAMGSVTTSPPSFDKLAKPAMITLYIGDRIHHVQQTTSLIQ